MSPNHRYAIQTVFMVLTGTVLASCSSLRSMSDGVSSSISSSSVNPVNWITPYKIDIIQGNFISSEQVAQLRPGMTRDEVKAVLGTPLVASLFHANRWDYVFTLKRQGVEPQSFKYTVFFKGDQLERFEGDAMPSEQEFIARLDSQSKPGKVPSLQATEAQLKAAEKSVPATPASNGSGVAADVPADPQATVYPPLESPKQ
ncbi:MAG: outer membrane protein assembly factor BamE [Polaromonas sp.]